jgi:hypothetical protein
MLSFDVACAYLFSVSIASVLRNLSGTRVNGRT